MIIEDFYRRNKFTSSLEIDCFHLLKNCAIFCHSNDSFEIEFWGRELYHNLEELQKVIDENKDIVRELKRRS